MNYIRRAFTLVETLVSIVVVMLLTGILVASLSEVRRSGREAATLSNLRQHHAVFSAYSGDYADCWPLLITPPRDPGALTGSSGIVLAEPYFGQHVSWTGYMADGYYAGGSAAIFESPVGGNGVAYYYGCSFIARPEYWTGEARPSATLWGATRHSDVSLPSEKALLLDYGSWWLQVDHDGRRSAPLPAAFVDGSIVKASSGNFFPGCTGGDGPWVGAMHFQDGFPGLHTLNGVRGRDRRAP